MKKRKKNNTPRIHPFYTGLLIVLGMTSLNQLMAQPETIKIPGTEVYFEMALVEKGKLEKESFTIQIDSFWIGTKEVSFDEYILFQDLEYDNNTASAGIDYQADAVTRPTPPYEDFSKGMGRQGGYPAVSMTQQAAQLYCYWLYQKTGVFYRLPTEAEWEYACLKGNSDFKSEKDLDDSAWYYENSFEKFHKTGLKSANQLGLYDMLGNVAEWTADYFLSENKYSQYLEDSTAINPWIVPQRRHPRTVKGGSYDDNPEDCTCKSRLKSKAKWQARDPQIPKSKWWNPDSPFVGFRIVRPVQQPSPKEIEAYFQKAIKY